MPEGSFQRLLMESNARKLWCGQENKGFPVIGPFNVFILRMRIRFLENILIVLVTTHDLALTKITDQLGVRAANVHFEDRIENGEMVFDFKMRPGVVERSNALALMRSIGLDV